MPECSGIAYVFPGQGSQQVGMGRDLYESFASVKDIFERADKVMGFSLSRLCFEGPEDELRQTINAQPAILTASYACLQAFHEAHPTVPAPDFVAGHSLGEYTALAATGVVDFEAAVYLARERGRLMHQASVIRPGSMAAVIGMDEMLLAEVCQETGTYVVNINCPGQLVFSGDQDRVTQAAEVARAKGAARVIPLPVSAAFHTPLMRPAVDKMSEIIDGMAFAEPAIPIIANTTAQPLTTAQAVREELIQQLCHCVQWQGSVEYMIGQGVSTFMEFGPGKVLTGLIRRIDKGVTTVNIGDVQTVKGNESA
jgi:[acyl-carrier-protein] S-malonyltransferase